MAQKMGPLAAVVGVDLGSTALRARLLTPGDGRIYAIESRQYGKRRARYDLGDFSVMGYPFDTCGDVYLGEDPNPEREAVPLKYGMYVLSRELDSMVEEYQHHSILREGLDIPGFKQRILQGLKQLFLRVYRQIEVVCTENELCLTTIGLSIPAQWGPETEGIYKGIVQSVVRKPSIEINFVTEIDALAHFLCRDYRSKIVKQPNPIGYDTILFIDFGGHSMNSCILHVRNNGTAADTRRFYVVGNAVGAGGGSERWENYVLEKAIENIETTQGKPGIMSPQHKQKLRDEFDEDKGRYGLKTNKSFTFESTKGLDGKPFELTLTHETIKSCFEKATRPTLQMAEKQIQELISVASTKDAWVAVSGGTAQHEVIQEKIRELCKKYHVHHPPIFIDALTIAEHSVKVAQGVAYAVGNSITVEDFIRKGAAFGIQKRRHSRKNVPKDEDDWDDLATFFMSKDHQNVRTKIKVNGLDDLKVICDPFFRPTGDDNHLYFDNCYDIFLIGKPSKGDWYFSMVLEGRGDTMSMVMKRWVKAHLSDATALYDETRIPLYFDKGKNCVLAKGIIDSEYNLPLVTLEPSGNRIRGDPTSRCRVIPADALPRSSQNSGILPGVSVRHAEIPWRKRRLISSSKVLPANASPSSQRSDSIATVGYDSEIQVQGYADSGDPDEREFLEPRSLASSALEVMRGTRTPKRRRRRLVNVMRNLDDGDLDEW